MSDELIISPTEMLNPENAWKSVDKNNRKSPFANSDTLAFVHNAIKEFAELCSVEVWGWGQSDLSRRPYNTTFEQVYLFRAREIFKKLQVGEKDISLSEIFNEYMDQGIELPKDTIRAICFGKLGQLGSFYGPNTLTPMQDYLSNQNRFRIVHNFAKALGKMMEDYGEERVASALRESTALTEDKGRGMGH